MIRDICELAQSMQLFGLDLRVMENTGPTVEMLPIPIKYPVSNVLKELRSRIRRCDGELNCKSIQLLRVADGFEDALDRIVWQPQSVIGDDANTELMAIIDDPFLMRFRDGLPQVAFEGR